MGVSVSCLPVSLFEEFFQGRLTLEQWSILAEQAGLTHIDINRRCLMDMGPDRAAAEAARCRLPFLMVTTYSDFSNPDPEARRRAVDAAREDARLTAALGARYLRLTAGQHYPGQDARETVGHICDCFAAVLDTARRAGVGILLENHSKPGAWQYPDFNFHMERMLLLWEAIRTLPIGINYDTANAFALGDWRRLMDAFGTRITTVHVNDLDSLAPLHFCCAGEGRVDLAEQFAALRARGFEGPFSLEEAGMEGRDAVRRAAANTLTLLAGAGYPTRRFSAAECDSH